MLTLRAPAKVNLTLEVLGRRDDGYHDIVSIMQTVDLCDTITFEPADALAIDCDDASIDPSENLALRAATLLDESTGGGKGAKIRLEKSIPVAAGLGGGSSDAAATLVGLNRLWDLGLPIERLVDLAARLGSDVPFFIHGGVAMVQGRGERVRPLSAVDLDRMVILSPKIAVPEKTSSLYRKLTPSHYTRGALTRKLEARIRGGGDAPPQFFFNAFDAVAFEAYPTLETYWNELSALGAGEIHLAGSGPSLFAPVARKELGTAIQLMLEHSHGWDAHLVSAWDPASEGGVWAR